MDAFDWLVVTYYHVLSICRYPYPGKALPRPDPSQGQGSQASSLARFKPTQFLPRAGQAPLRHIQTDHTPRCAYRNLHHGTPSSKNQNR
jgi:hypothetical protein